MYGKHTSDRLLVWLMLSYKSNTSNRLIVWLMLRHINHTKKQTNKQKTANASATHVYVQTPYFKQGVSVAYAQV